ncbi:retrovirus-related pol polyprotein from transposon TNT 1-94, partial [Tanacetum coccineum]
RTNNGTKFVNQTLREYYEKVGISHETSVAHFPQQNGVVERRNCTLIEVARTMLIYAKALLFLWAKAVAIACYTQNRSIIRLHHRKTPYELLHDKLPDLSFFHVFGALCYQTNDSENLGKLQPKANIDNGTEFVNQTLREYYEKVGISHETSFARSPQQNGVVERRNRTLIEAARTMLIYAKAPLFLWTEAVATACYTQNRSIVRLCHGKTPYELLHDKLPDLSFFHVFGALCYPTNDSENLDFDELTAMASEHSSSGPALHEMTPAIISLGLVPNPPPSTPFFIPDNGARVGLWIEGYSSVRWLHRELKDTIRE